MSQFWNGEVLAAPNLIFTVQAENIKKYYISHPGNSITDRNKMKE